MAKKRSAKPSSTRPAKPRKTRPAASKVLDFLNGIHQELFAAKQAAARQTGDLAAKEGQPLGEQLDAAIAKFADHLGEEYTYTDPFGHVLDRQALGQRLRGGSGLFGDFVRTDQDVRQYGRHVIITSLLKVRGEHDGLEASGGYYETHILEQRPNEWRLLSTHLTRIQEMNPLIIKAVDACDGAELFTPLAFDPPDAERR